MSDNIIENIKTKLRIANRLYRAGYISNLSDKEYDDSLDTLEKLMIEQNQKTEFLDFKNSLHELKGEVEHPFVLGSLSKIKSDDIDSLTRFLKTKQTSNKLSVSAKVDGISCRLRYMDGKLFLAATRGDGYSGQNLSDKIRFVKNIPENIKYKDTIDIRGELVIYRDDFDKYLSGKGFSNPRNAVAGIMNRKLENLDKNDIEDFKHVSFLAYTVLSDKYTKIEQFRLLKELGFQIPNSIILDIKNNKNLDSVKSISEYLISLTEQQYLYETDGLVISDINYINESEYRPKNQFAFKHNQLFAETRLIDIEFTGPSKDGKFIPVGILEPVDLGGSTISRVTLHNIEFIKAMNLKYGCFVKIVKSGDVIPRILSRSYNLESSISGQLSDIIFPTHCPSCNSILDNFSDKLNLICTNKDCKGKKLQEILSFIKNLGVKSVSDKTLEKYNIYSIDDMICFLEKMKTQKTKKSKTEKKIESEFLDKIFNKNISKQELLSVMNFSGIGKKQLTNIINFYGIDTITDIERLKKLESDISDGKVDLPKGIGNVLMKEKFFRYIYENLELLNKIVTSDYFDTVTSV